MFSLLLLIKPGVKEHTVDLRFNWKLLRLVCRFFGRIFGWGVPALFSRTLLPAEGGGGAKRPVCGRLLLSQRTDLWQTTATYVFRGTLLPEGKLPTISLQNYVMLTTSKLYFMELHEFSWVSALVHTAVISIYIVIIPICLWFMPLFRQKIY